MNAPAQIEAVVTDAEAAPQEIAALEEAFRRAGLDVEVNAVLERKSAGQLVPWVVSVTLTVQSPRSSPRSPRRLRRTPTQRSSSG